MKNLGYEKPLFVLAFDHRSSFTWGILGIPGEPDKGQIEQICDYKQVIFEGFMRGVAKGVPREQAAVLCDEQFGPQVLKGAREQGFVFAQTVEKSGQKEFMFEYEDFGEHLKKYQPTFAKALVRFNPEDEDRELNQRQLARLKELSDFCHQNGFKLLVEPLIPATKSQLAAAGNDQKRYDLEIRPALMVEMVRQLQAAGVEPDVWKIEGLEKTEEYEAVTAQARNGGRDKVAAVILGRGADGNQVEKWLAAAAKAQGLIGFAIGRTIFHQALMDYKNNQISREEAAERIGENYFKFYDIYKSNQ